MRTDARLLITWAAAFLLMSCGSYINAQIITTVAGNGSNGYSGDGVIATSTALNLPRAVSIDTNGNLFIADECNNRVRRVNTDGIIMTVAGNGYTLGLSCNGGFSGDGGAATIAELSHPVGVALRASGDFYIVDSENNRIRKVSAAGTITTVVGGGRDYPGSGGAATSALLGNPRGMAVDAAGNLYIADTGFNRVVKIDAAGLMTIIAGTGFYDPGYSGDGGAATSAKLHVPEGVAVDAAGNLYIADTRNNRIRKVDSVGTITTVAGNGAQGFAGDGSAATSAQIYNPSVVAVDASGNLYFNNGDVIRKVDVMGIITTVAGRHGQVGGIGDGGPATSARLDTPIGVALDPAGNLYIADRGQNRIRKVSVSHEIFRNGFDL